eukprot:1375202-Amphidinium_carterae.1
MLKQTGNSINDSCSKPLVHIHVMYLEDVLRPAATGAIPAVQRHSNQILSGAEVPFFEIFVGLLIEYP